MKNRNYKIVLYQNGRHVKTFAYFKTYPETLDKYTKKLAENKIFFAKQVDWLGTHVEYELAILGKKGKRLEYITNELGIKIPITMKNGGEYFIKEIQPYYIEEKFKYWNKNKMIKFKDLIKSVIMRTTTTKLVYSFNNKVLIIDDTTDDYHLFIVKCENDATRLVDLIRKFCITNNVTSLLFFYDNFDTHDLYPKIMNKLGVKRTELWKVSTR